MQFYQIAACDQKPVRSALLLTPRGARCINALVRLFVTAVLLAGLGALPTACARTRYYQREALVHPAMAYDHDGATAFIRNKIEGAREGSFGGFGDNVAGGCGCE